MKTKTILAQSAIAIIPVVYYLFIWSKLPDQVPMHYDMNNQVNDWGSKSEMLAAILFMFLITILTSILLINIDKIDPKKKYSNLGSIIIKISWTLVLFLSALNTFIVYDTEVYVRTNQPAELLSPKIMLTFVSLLFVIIGNFMNSIKPNYFIGIRTPWNLEDEDNWRKTHHLASKLWFFGGLLAIPFLLLNSNEIATYIFICIIIPLTLIPFIYSFNIFRNKQKGNQ